MKIFKLLLYIVVISLFTIISFADVENDCSKIKSDTGVKIYEKIKCKMGQEKSEGISSKIKNIFKKKK